MCTSAPEVGQPLPTDVFVCPQDALSLSGKGPKGIVHIAFFFREINFVHELLKFRQFKIIID